MQLTFVAIGQAPIEVSYVLINLLLEYFLLATTVTCQ